MLNFIHLFKSWKNAIWDDFGSGLPQGRGDRGIMSIRGEMGTPSNLLFMHFSIEIDAPYYFSVCYVLCDDMHCPFDLLKYAHFLKNANWRPGSKNVIILMPTLHE